MLSIRVVAIRNFRLWRAALLCVAYAAARPAQAEPPLPTEPTAEAAPDAAQPPPARTGSPGIAPTALSWRDTILYWDHALSTNTLGVGRDYQSRNPVYEMTIGLRPRYYFVDDPRTTVSVRGDLAVVTERTNSDTTSRQGEWSATDLELFGSFTHHVRETKQDFTEVALRAPRLTFPTSKISYDSGKILGLGARLGLREDVVLQGRDADFFPEIEFIVKAEYGYLFTNSQVPVNGGLERIRVDPGGRSIVSDQLSGATMARHSAMFGGDVLLHVHQRLLWTTELEFRPAWKYAVDHDVQVCGVVLTGCTSASGIADPVTRSALTYFRSELWLTMTDSLSLLVGYANLSAQIGPDGSRRGVFYSPDARFYATLEVGLDHLYESVSRSKRQTARAASEPRSP